jgi:hypothetical protein
MPDEEVEEILSIKVIPTVDQTEEVRKIYLIKAPLLRIRPPAALACGWHRLGAPTPSLFVS